MLHAMFTLDAKGALTLELSLQIASWLNRRTQKRRMFLMFIGPQLMASGICVGIFDEMSCGENR